MIDHKELERLKKALPEATQAAVDAEEREVKIALKALCLSALDRWPDAAFIELGDSDQGPWATYDTVLNSSGEEIDGGDSWYDGFEYTMHLYDSRAYLLYPFLRDGTEPGHPERFPMRCTVDISKVLDAWRRNEP